MVRAVRMHAMLAMLATMAGRAAGATGCDDISASLGNAGEDYRNGNTQGGACNGYASECIIICNPGFERYNSESECVREGYPNSCVISFECIGDGSDSGGSTWTPPNNAVYCRRICGTQTNEQTRLTGASVTDPGTCTPCVSGTWAAADDEDCVPHKECTSSTEYESVAPTATSDRACAPISGCGYKLNGSTRLTNDGCSECDINTFAATYAENCTLMTVTAATCAELRDEHNVTVDGLYTLSLEVDAVKIAQYVPIHEQGCGIRTNDDPAEWSTRLNSTYAASGGYNPAAANVKCVVPTDLLNDDDRKVIPTPKQVWCHMMGSRPKSVGMAARAYVNVDPARNTAQFQYGMTLYTTSFSKLRFDERTQLIYTADCKCT